MRDIDNTAPVAGGRSSRSMATATNWVGAAISLALVIGIAVWGYRLIVRDVSGVPVVRAIDGPMRVAPENPGGQIARHEGLAVNNVAGQGSSAPPPDQIILAPRPLTIADEDLVLPDAVDIPDALIRPAVDATAAPVLEASQTASLALALADVSTAEDPIKALADQIAARATPGAEFDTAPGRGTAAGLDTAQDIAAAQIIPPSVPGVARSLRPARRPDGLQNVALSALVPTIHPDGVVERAPADIPEGTRLVQFGAYDSPAIAREQWTALTARFGAFLEGKARVVEEARSGGRVFYRLRAHGFENLSDSRRFCAALVAEGAECIPVVSR